MKRYLRWLWRRITGRCWGCGATRNSQHDRANCYHCRRRPRLCHWCNKTWNFGEAYSARKKTILDALELGPKVRR